MRTSDVIRAWRKILKGERPSLSIEITRECPLRCPGCYAYDAAHLGGGVTLRDKLNNHATVTDRDRIGCDRVFQP